MAVAQHHDAVSGTAKQVVTYDYEERLSAGEKAGMQVLNQAYQKLMSANLSWTLPEQEFCPLTNISKCNVTETSKQVSLCLLIVYYCNNC